MYDEKDLEADIKRFAVEVADDGRSASGRLLFGADVDGTLHYDFALRLPTLADQMAAEERGLAPLAQSIYLTLASITRLGSLTEVPDYAVLRASIAAPDFDALYAASAALKKKRLSLSDAATSGAA